MTKKNVWQFGGEILGDSWNYMPPILVPCAAKQIATQVLVIAKRKKKNFF